MGQVLMADGNPWDGRVGKKRGNPKSGSLLDEFGKWAHSESPYSSNNPTYNFDNVHLFSGEDFVGDTIGLAYMGVMCEDSWYNAGISEVVDVAFGATTVAHEIGHNFDMDHDGVGNNCAPDEFVMAAYAIEETDLYFSSCSADNFNDNVANLGCLSSTEPDVDWQTSTSTTLPSVLLSMVWLLMSIRPPDRKSVV